MTRETLVRERSSHLLYQLLKDEVGDCQEDAAGALRLMSHASLNLAAELGTDSVQRAGEALVWLALFAQWESGALNASELGQELVQRRLVDSLAESMVQRRLEKVEAGRVATVLNQAPREARTQLAQAGQAEVEVLAALHRLDHELRSVLRCDDTGLMDRLFSDSMLLYAALELSREAESRTGPMQAAAQRLAQLLGPASRERMAALEILGEIERGEFEQIPGAFAQLSERSQRFEISLAQNMQQHGLLCAVRAALGFVERFEDDGKSRELRLLADFSRDDELAELALVLMEMRGRCHGYFSGALGIEALRPWVMYLRNGCMELAESRGLTLREAIGFAHYCLHLMNICDLGGRGTRVITEETRRALMDIEDDLKEFALSSQRAGVSDAQVNLDAFERGRWKRSGDNAYIVDRLARLSGGWRAGVRPGPVGAPARLDGQALTDSQALIDEVITELARNLPESGVQKALGVMAALLRNCQLQGAELLETVTLEEAFKVLSFGLSAARDLPGIDVNQPFWIDLRLLLQESAPAQLRPMLGQVLKRRPREAFFSGFGEPNASACGLVGSVVGEPGGAATLVVSLKIDAEMAALLELMSHSSSQSVRLRAMLEARLDELLDANQDEIPADLARAQKVEKSARKTSLRKATADAAEVTLHAQPGTRAAYGAVSENSANPARS